MTAEETKNMASQQFKLEAEPELLSLEERWRNIEDDAKKEKTGEGCKQNSKEDYSSPRCVLDMASDSSDQRHGNVSSTASSVVHKALSPENYGLPFKGFMDAVKNSSVKKLSSSTLAVINGYDLSKKTMRRKLGRSRTGDEDLPWMKQSWMNFEYAELASATDNFVPEKMIGKGGHAEVYKGCLANGTVIAVKKLNKEIDLDEDTVQSFLSELGVIAHVEHPNAAKLIGFGVENGLYLVLQFAPLGSLASHLYGSREGLKWSVRYRIAVGVADGLAYLHHTCRRRIIHRDIKASNILLCDNFEPVISDFGLAKWLPENWTNHVVHPVEGTLGYLAPEYFMHGIVDEKTDVFAFGVVLLELLTGRHAVDSGHNAEDSTRQSLVMWAKPLLDAKDVTELIDPQLGGEYNQKELRQVLTTAAMCIHHEPCHRPHMNMVTKLLKGEAGIIMDLQQRSIEPRSMLIDDVEDYTRSNYLQDLSRHKELLME